MNLGRPTLFAAAVVSAFTTAGMAEELPVVVARVPKELPDARINCTIRSDKDGRISYAVPFEKMWFGQAPGFHLVAKDPPGPGAGICTLRPQPFTITRYRGTAHCAACEYNVISVP